MGIPARESAARHNTAKDESQAMAHLVDKPVDKLGNDWEQASGCGTTGFYPESTPAPYRHYSAFMPAPVS
jgi:hypothetical protein